MFQHNSYLVSYFYKSSAWLRGYSDMRTARNWFVRKHVGNPFLMALG